MAHYQRVSGEKCYLSPPDASDAEQIKAWDNNLQVLLGASMDGVSTPASTLYRTADKPSRMLEHLMMIVDLETNMPIGWCAPLGVRSLFLNPARSEVAASTCET